MYVKVGLYKYNILKSGIVLKMKIKVLEEFTPFGASSSVVVVVLIGMKHIYMFITIIIT